MLSLPRSAILTMSFSMKSIEYYDEASFSTTLAVAPTKSSVLIYLHVAKHHRVISGEFKLHGRPSSLRRRIK